MAVTKMRGQDSAGDGVETPRGRGRPQLRCDQETRGVIVDAARQQFAGSGFAGTSMDSVARAAGVSTKTLYRLFPNKVALFEGMVAERTDALVSTVKLRACDGGDVEPALAEALLMCGELMLDGEVIALQRVVAGESDKFPDIAETFFNKAIMRTQGALADWLRVQVKRGTIALDDVDVAAGMLLGMLALQPLRAAMFGHRPPPNRKEIGQRARACAALFLGGCRRQP
jgi:AcrR family transcriptional regulator